MRVGAEYETVVQRDERIAAIKMGLDAAIKMGLDGTMDALFMVPWMP